jgi:hypothetical protein
MHRSHPLFHRQNRLDYSHLTPRTQPQESNQRSTFVRESQNRTHPHPRK